MTAISGWLGNRVDSPVTIEVTDELAREFMASRLYSEDRMLYPSLTLWLASKDGRNIAWENTPDDLAAIEDLYDRVRKIERAAK